MLASIDCDHCCSGNAFVTKIVNCSKVIFTHEAYLKPKNASGQGVFFVFFSFYFPGSFLSSITLSIKQQMKHKKIEHVHIIRTARQIAQGIEGSGFLTRCPYCWKKKCWDMKANPTREMGLKQIKTFFLKRKTKPGNSSAKPWHVTLLHCLNC